MHFRATPKRSAFTPVVPDDLSDQGEEEWSKYNIEYVIEITL